MINQNEKIINVKIKSDGLWVMQTVFIISARKEWFDTGKQSELNFVRFIFIESFY